MRFQKKDIFTIPNILTYIRLLCVPFFAWMVLDTHTEGHLWWAFGLFIFASVTDVVDGVIARKCNMTSDIGKVLDPLADKLLQITAVITLTLIGNIHPVFPFIFVIKETYMIIGAGILLLCVRKKVTIQANVWGKLATVLFAMAIVTSFFHDELVASKVYLDIFLFSLAAVLTLVAAVIYTITMVKEIRAHKNIKGSIVGDDILAGNDILGSDDAVELDPEDIIDTDATDIDDRIVIDVDADEIEE